MKRVKGGVLFPPLTGLEKAKGRTWFGEKGWVRWRRWEKQKALTEAKCSIKQLLFFAPTLPPRLLLAHSSPLHPPVIKGGKLPLVFFGKKVPGWG